MTCCPLMVCRCSVGAPEVARTDLRLEPEDSVLKRILPPLGLFFQVITAPCPPHPLHPTPTGSDEETQNDTEEPPLPAVEPTAHASEETYCLAPAKPASITSSGLHGELEAAHLHSSVLTFELKPEAVNTDQRREPALIIARVLHSFQWKRGVSVFHQAGVGGMHALSTELSAAASMLLPGIWRIPVDEIDRPGSFASHMNRSIVLLLEVLSQLKDHDTLLKVSEQPSKVHLPPMGEMTTTDVSNRAGAEDARHAPPKKPPGLTEGACPAGPEAGPREASQSQNSLQAMDTVEQEQQQQQQGVERAEKGEGGARPGSEEPMELDAGLWGGAARTAEPFPSPPVTAEAPGATAITAEPAEKGPEYSRAHELSLEELSISSKQQQLQASLAKGQLPTVGAEPAVARRPSRKRKLLEDVESGKTLLLDAYRVWQQGQKVMTYDLGRIEKIMSETFMLIKQRERVERVQQPEQSPSSSISKGSPGLIDGVVPARLSSGLADASGLSDRCVVEGEGLPQLGSSAKRKLPERERGSREAQFSMLQQLPTQTTLDLSPFRSTLSQNHHNESNVLHNREHHEQARKAPERQIGKSSLVDEDAALDQAVKFCQIQMATSAQRQLLCAQPLISVFSALPVNDNDSPTGNEVSGRVWGIPHYCQPHCSAHLDASTTPALHNYSREAMITHVRLLGVPFHTDSHGVVGILLWRRNERQLERSVPLGNPEWSSSITAQRTHRSSTACPGAPAPRSQTSARLTAVQRSAVNPSLNQVSACATMNGWIELCHNGCTDESNLSTQGCSGRPCSHIVHPDSSLKPTLPHSPISLADNWDADQSHVKSSSATCCIKMCEIEVVSNSQSVCLAHLHPSAAFSPVAMAAAPGAGVQHGPPHNSGSPQGPIAKSSSMVLPLRPVQLCAERLSRAAVRRIQWIRPFDAAVTSPSSSDTPTTPKHTKEHRDIFFPVAPPTATPLGSPPGHHPPHPQDSEAKPSSEPASKAQRPPPTTSYCPPIITQDQSQLRRHQSHPAAMAFLSQTGPAGGRPELISMQEEMRG
ncbi:hypothetical protein JZ751_001532 [Albula glossodonta]|uniref:Uncharacterized protein n=1 Tax=Albula glossodonta TaxID=121402 RepID=A0A8T2PTZ9_9TELE|nr:hypothetical protein JZ751_001532 [Albula glossodonta]